MLITCSPFSIPVTRPSFHLMILETGTVYRFFLRENVGLLIYPLLATLFSTRNKCSLLLVATEGP